jgi:hypothetical protein
MRTKRGSYVKLDLDKKALAAAIKAVPELKAIDTRFSERVRLPVYDLGVEGLSALAEHYRPSDPKAAETALSYKAMLESAGTAKFGPRMLGEA